MQKRQKELELTQLEHQYDLLYNKSREMQLEDNQLRELIRTKGRFDGMTDLWEASERNKRAIARNEEAMTKLDIKIDNLRAELRAAAAEAAVMTD